MIIFLCLYSLATSVIDIINGGKVVELDVAFPYLIASIFVCFVLWLFFKNKAVTLQSEYLRIESTEWQLDALLSFGVLIVLSLGYFLKAGPLAYLIPYLDPAMVAVISIVFLRIPANTFWKNVRELLQFAPDDEVEDKIHDVSEQICQEYEFIDSWVRVAKTGKSYTVEIDFLLPKSLASTPVSKLDEIRQQLHEQIKGDYEMWLTISFTTERKWMM